MNPRNAPPPPKSTGKQGDGTPAKAQKIKGRSKSVTTEPQAWSKASPQQGAGHVCSPLHTRPSRHRMNVVPLVVLTVRCLATRQHKQMVGRLLVRVPNQRHPA